MTPGPLFAFAALFAVFALFDWRRLPACARLSLGAATVFAIAGFQYPGAGPGDVVDPHLDGLAYVVDLARAVGFGAVAASLAFMIRGTALR